MTTENAGLSPETIESSSDRPVPITLRRALFQLLALPSAFVASLAAIFLVVAVSLLDAADRVGRCDRAIAQSFLVQKLLLDMESGTRDYLVTGRGEFLHLYMQAEHAIDAALPRLGELLGEDPAQARRYADLRRQAEAWRRRASESIAWRRGRTQGDRLDAVALESKMWMDPVRDQLAGCIAAEEVRRDRQWRSAQSTARLGLVGAGFAALILGGALAIGTRRRMSRVSSAYEAAIATAQDRSEALRVSEARFQAFMNNAPALTFIKDEEGRYVYGNRAWTALLRKPAADPSGRPGALPPGVETERSPGGAAPGAQETCAGVGLDGTGRGPNGEECQWITLEFPLDDGSGRRLRGGLAVDVTELRKTERELRASEERYALAVQGASAGLWDWTCPTGVIYYSPRFKELIGYEDHEFASTLENFLSRLHPDDNGAAMEKIRQHLSSRAPYDDEYRLQTKAGDYRWFHARGQAVWDERGEPTRMSGSITDITARKQAEEEILALNTRLERRLQRLASLRRIDSTITMGLDLRTTLAIVLEQVRAQLHVDAADVLLLDPKTQILHHEASTGFQTDALTKVRLPLSRHGSGRVVLERRPLHVANLNQWTGIFVRAIPFADEGFVVYHGVPLLAKGEVKGVLEVFHRGPLEIDQEWIDFLETLAGQAAIAIENMTLNEELRRANAELTLAYDATIEGWSRALDLRDKETEGHSQRVTEMTVRLARAMAVSAEDIVQIRRGALLHDIGKMGIPDRILLKPGPLTDEEWQVMRRHPDYAREMLSPIEFLRPAIDIPYSHHERWDGSGYPQGLSGEEIPLAARIFTLADIWDALSNDRPYRKAWNQARVLEYIASLSGTTLDPTVVETFMRLHQAGLMNDLDRFTTSSSPTLSGSAPWDQPGVPAVETGHGKPPASSRPILHAPQRAGSQRNAPAPGDLSASAGLKILIADGDWPTANLLKRKLQEMGHEAILAADGRDALQVIRRDVPRAVIADWKLAVVDGPELCRRVRGDTERRPPYIILTGDRDGTPEKELPFGADDFLAKPFDPRELEARLAVARRMLVAQEQLLDRTIQAERMYVELRHQNERLAELVATDPLTGLSNRRHLLEVLESQAALSQRQALPLSLAILDVDRFKQYNDDYGHRAGDDVLCLMADILRGSVRASDLVARYGGEEFVVVMPMTDESGGVEAAERVRVAIAEFSWPLRPITGSFGVATMDPDSQNISRLIDAADQALYRSKQRGRNRTTHSQESAAEPGDSRLLPLH